MSKKKKIVYSVIIMLFFLLMIGGYAYAKYFSKVNGLVFSDIAIWRFKINGNTDKIQSINLYDTCEENTKTNGKIAPGTKGKIKIQIDATGSDVSIDYNFNFEESGSKPENIKFIYENQEYNDLNEIKKYIDGRINSNEINKIRDIEIDWIWRYESGNSIEEIEESDKKDTQDGMYLNQYNIDITVIGSQVDI